MTNEARSSLVINLSRPLFTYIDEIITEEQGVGFADLASERPVAAYSYLSRIALGAAVKPERIKVDDMLLTSAQDGQETVTGAAKQVMERIKIDSDKVPVDVVVSIFGKQKFRDAIRGIRAEPAEVISFHIEPPNQSK